MHSKPELMHVSTLSWQPESVDNCMYIDLLRAADRPEVKMFRSALSRVKRRPRTVCVTITTRLVLPDSADVRLDVFFSGFPRDIDVFKKTSVLFIDCSKPNGVHKWIEQMTKIDASGRRLAHVFPHLEQIHLSSALNDDGVEVKDENGECTECRTTRFPSPSQTQCIQDAQSFLGYHALQYGGPGVDGKHGNCAGSRERYWRTECPITKLVNCLPLLCCLNMPHFPSTVDPPGVVMSARYALETMEVRMAARWSWAEATFVAALFRSCSGNPLVNGAGTLIRRICQMALQREVPHEETVMQKCRWLSSIRVDDDPRYYAQDSADEEPVSLTNEHPRDTWSRLQPLLRTKWFRAVAASPQREIIDVS